MNTEVKLYKWGVVGNVGQWIFQSGIVPIFSDSVVFNKSRENGEMYFRESLEGTWNFIGAGYTILASASTSDKFKLEVYVDNVLVGSGTFFKYDCEFDADAQRVKIKVTHTDNYTKILAKISNEYDIVQLATPASSVNLTKRAVLQFYVPGETKLTNVIGGSSYEVECKQKTDQEMATGWITLRFRRVVNRGQLYIDYKYIYNESQRTSAEKQFLTQISGLMLSPNDNPTGEMTNNLYKFEYGNIEVSAGEGITLVYKAITIRPIGGGTAVGYITNSQGGDLEFGSSCNVRVGTESGSRAVLGNIIAVLPVGNYAKSLVWGRMIFDKEGMPYASSISADNDITEQNLNYRYCQEYPTILGDYVKLSGEVTTEATRWGKTEDGTRYYKAPSATSTTYRYPIIPLGASLWGFVSMWFIAPCYDLPDDYGNTLEDYDAQVTIKDTYSLHDVITTLLNQIDSTIKFSNTSDYSQFFYDANDPFSKQVVGLLPYFTPITNVKKSYYSTPAQKGKLSLKALLDALKACYQVYWFIEEKTIGGVLTKCLRLEHVSYFKRGYSYAGVETLLADLTTMHAPRSGQTWASGLNKTTYEKDELPSRYEFGWATETTESFNGYPIKTLDEEVQSSEKKQISAAPFDADIDIMLAIPSIFPDDGFAMIEADSDGNCPLEYVSAEADDTTAYYIQNGTLSFFFIAQYYYYHSLGGVNNQLDGCFRTLANSHGAVGENVIYDIPFSDVRAEALLKAMKQSSVVFPLSVSSLRQNGFVKTGIGNGEVTSLKWNIETGIATAELIFTPN